MQEPSKYMTMQAFCAPMQEPTQIHDYAGLLLNHAVTVRIDVGLLRNHAGTFTIYAGLLRNYAGTNKIYALCRPFAHNHAETITIYALCRSFAQPCRNYLNVVKQFRNKSETTKDAAGLLLRKKVQQVASTYHRPFFHRKVIESSLQVPLSLWITS
jgi:hypothetical protein